MALDSFLAEVLACPCSVHSAVRVQQDCVECITCRSTFPIRHGIPVMLLDDATPGPRGIGISVNEGSGE